MSVHAVTGALKNFFKLLPEPLIPYDFGKQINAIMGEWIIYIGGSKRFLPV